MNEEEDKLAQGPESPESGDGQDPEEKTQVGEPPEQEAEALREKLAKTEEQLLYLQAEFENTKIRLRREQEKAIKFANEQIVKELLPVADFLERALVAAGPLRAKGGAEIASFVDGVVMTQQELTQVLARHGVELVGNVGESFDPNLHEAVSQREGSPEEHDKIVDVVQKGSRLHGRLIKPAKVVVAKSSPQT